MEFIITFWENPFWRAFILISAIVFLGALGSMLGYSLHHRAALRRAGQHGVEVLKRCPVCQGELEIGTVQPISYAKGARFNQAVAAIRCTKCGRLELFTNP